MLNPKTLLLVLMTFALSTLSFAAPGDLTPEEAMAKLKAKEEVRRVAATTQAAAELVTARASNAELRKENESLKAELAKLKADLQQVRQQLAEVQQKVAKATGDSAHAKPGSNIFEDLDK